MTVPPRLRDLQLLLAALSLLGCSARSGSTDAADGCAVAESATRVCAAPGRDFDLAPGSSAQIIGSRVRVTFELVTEDSRCPIGAQCVWEGRATAQLVFDSAGTSKVIALSHSGAGRAAAVFGYTIELQSLRPAPTTEAHPRQEEYRLTLRATRLGG